MRKIIVYAEKKDEETHQRSKGCEKIVKRSLRRVIGLPVEAQVTSHAPLT